MVIIFFYFKNWRKNILGGYQKIDQIKAGTHPYDNTVRPQILEKNMNENYYNLIDKFFELSKIPALLNTSLNVKGEPLVNTVEDARRFESLNKLKVITP